MAFRSRFEDETFAKSGHQVCWSSGGLKIFVNLHRTHRNQGIFFSGFIFDLHQNYASAYNSNSQPFWKSFGEWFCNENVADCIASMKSKNNWISSAQALAGIETKWKLHQTKRLSIMRIEHVSAFAFCLRQRNAFFFRTMVMSFV